MAGDEHGGEDRSEDNSEDNSEDRAAKLRELIELERRCGELRSTLGLTHQIAAPRMSKAAEQAMHALIGDHASDFLSVHAGDGAYLWASPSCERLFGWTPAQLVGRSAYDLFHPEDLARIAENHTRHVDGDDAGVVEYRLRCANDEYRWVVTHSANSKDEHGLPLIVCFTRDITEQREHRLLLERLLAERERDGAEARDLIRLCAWCRRIASPTHDDLWQPLEIYLRETTGREVSHGMCDRCAADYVES